MTKKWSNALILQLLVSWIYKLMFIQTIKNAITRNKISVCPPTFFLDCLNSVPHLGHSQTHRVIIRPSLLDNPISFEEDGINSLFATIFPLKSQLGLLQIKDFDRSLRLNNSRTIKQEKKITQFIRLSIDPNQSGWKRRSESWMKGKIRIQWSWSQ